jgi:hypothetical protein
MMETRGFDKLFAPDVLKQLFPEDRSDQFFDALYGDAEIQPSPKKQFKKAMRYGFVQNTGNPKRLEIIF